MMGVAAVVCVALLVATVFVRGYTMKVLNQVRAECGGLISDERRLRQECEQVEILEESASARRDQTQSDIDKYSRELDDLIPAIAQLEAELNKANDDDEA
ncbi:hypothetical protein ACFL6X_06180 [Candidatus Latescibacterota bacterium]